MFPYLSNSHAFPPSCFFVLFMYSSVHCLLLYCCQNVTSSIEYPSTYIKHCAVGGEDLIHCGPEEDAVDVEDSGLVHLLIEVDDADDGGEDLKSTFKVLSSFYTVCQGLLPF